jgi:hypothetical protein
MMTFFLAMALHPNIMRKVQHDLDAVTGRVRLPTFEDRERLPFVDAVCREVLRWQPVTPLGEPTDGHSSGKYLEIFIVAVPHATTEDNVYDGFFIPKGVYLVPSSFPC